MANPNFISRVILHWIGPEDGFETISESADTSTPMYSAADGDDQAFITEAARDLVEQSTMFGALKEGDYVLVLLAGKLDFYTCQTADGPEDDMDVDVDWHRITLLHADEIAAVNEVEGISNNSIGTDDEYVALG